MKYLKLFELKYSKKDQSRLGSARFKNIKFNVGDLVFYEPYDDSMFSGILMKIIDIETTFDDDFFWYVIEALYDKNMLIPQAKADQLRLATDYEINAIKYNL